MNSPLAGNPTGWKAWLAYATVCIAWGTTYLAIAEAVETIPPFLAGGSRFLITGVAMLVALRLAGFQLPTREDWRRLVGPALLMLAVGNGLVCWAELVLPSGIAAILASLSPFAFVAVSRALGDPIPGSTWLGLALSFCGVLLLFSDALVQQLVFLVEPALRLEGDRSHELLLPALAMVVACSSWGVGAALSARYPTKASPWMGAACQMILGGLAQLLVSLALGEARGWAGPSWGSIWATVYLMVVGSVLGFGSYVYVLRRFPADTVSYVTYINTVVAVALGWLLRAEPLGLETAVGCGVIIAGIYVVNRGLARLKAERARASGVSRPPAETADS